MLGPSSDVIIRGGANVDPAEVEAILADSLPGNTNGKVLARDLSARLERQL